MPVLDHETHPSTIQKNQKYEACQVEAAKYLLNRRG